MDDQMIIYIVGAVIAILSVFGLWTKTFKKFTAIKEWIDVINAATVTLIDGITALADGKLEQSELDKLKADADKFKKELEEAKAAKWNKV